MLIISKLTTITYRNLSVWLCSISAVFVVTFNTSTQNTYHFSRASCGLSWSSYKYLMKYLECLFLITKKCIDDFNPKCLQLYFTRLLFSELNMRTQAVVVPSSYLILVPVCRKMSQVRALPGVFHADSDQISWWADDDFLQMLQCPVWTPMERLNPLHFQHFNGFIAYVALFSFEPIFIAKRLR